MADVAIALAAKTRRGRFTVAAVAFLGLVWPFTLALQFPTPQLRHPAIIDSAYFAFALWAGSCLLRIQSPRLSLPVVRWSWLAGSLLFLVHVGYAFHFAHGWSHANAVKHVEETSGFGPGIFLSYSFAVIWLMDAIWLFASPGSYRHRPKWMNRTISAFLAFIAFNGTVVYGHGFLRWVCAIAFAMLAFAWIYRFKVSRSIP